MSWNWFNERRCLLRSNCFNDSFNDPKPLKLEKNFFDWSISPTVPFLTEWGEYYTSSEGVRWIIHMRLCMTVHNENLFINSSSSLAAETLLHSIVEIASSKCLSLSWFIILLRIRTRVTHLLDIPNCVTGNR